MCLSFLGSHLIYCRFFCIIRSSLLPPFSTWNFTTSRSGSSSTHVPCSAIIIINNIILSHDDEIIATNIIEQFEMIEWDTLHCCPHQCWQRCRSIVSDVIDGTCCFVSCYDICIVEEFNRFVKYLNTNQYESNQTKHQFNLIKVIIWIVGICHGTV